MQPLIRYLFETDAAFCSPAIYVFLSRPALYSPRPGRNRCNNRCTRTHPRVQVRFARHPSARPPKGKCTTGILSHPMILQKCCFSSPMLHSVPRGKACPMRLSPIQRCAALVAKRRPRVTLAPAVRADLIRYLCGRRHRRRGRLRRRTVRPGLSSTAPLRCTGRGASRRSTGRGRALFRGNLCCGPYYACYQACDAPEIRHPDDDCENPDNDHNPRQPLHFKYEHNIRPFCTADMFF
jgi:hypothetical protein